MGWIIFWSIVIVWFVIGFKRQPVYYKRHFEKQQKFWSNIKDKTIEHHKEAAWVSLGLVFIWPFYELGLFYRNSMINHMTREERAIEKYEAAKKIVDKWEADKKAEFDKQLKGF